jgi:hypothetical protein
MGYKIPISTEAKRASIRSSFVLFCCALALILGAVGCATPIGVNYVDQRIA